MSTAVILGATGLCGGALLKYASISKEFSRIICPLRREKFVSHATNVEFIVEADPTKFLEKVDACDIFMTALATTRGKAGSFEAQYKIDHDLNIDLAKQAKDKGAKTCVIVSSSGANVNSYFSYLKMKGEIERDIEAIGFDKLIILRPGALIGPRDSQLKGRLNAISEAVGTLFYRSWLQGAAGYPVTGEEVGRVGVKLALERPNGVHIIESKEILELAGQPA